MAFHAAQNAAIGIQTGSTLNNNTVTEFGPSTALILQIEVVRLVGIFIVLYQHENSKVKLSETYTSFVATGFLKFGNKGGVGISMMLNDSLVCFINSHLAAGSELTKRNQVRLTGGLQYAEYEIL